MIKKAQNVMTIEIIIISVQESSLSPAIMQMELFGLRLQ